MLKLIHRFPATLISSMVIFIGIANFIPAKLLAGG
jgi:hypothetical protein